MADNAEFVRGLLEAWNDRDFDVIMEATAPDAVLTDAGSGATFRGRDGIRGYNMMWAEAFPDGRITVDRVIASGDTVVAEYTGNGTHTEPLVTSGGTIPATGRSVTLHFCDIYDIRDGKIHTQHTYGDSGSLMAQLGLTAGQAATTS